MIKDIDISHYYKKFIETSNDDMAKYNKELEVIKNMGFNFLMIMLN